MTGRRPTGRPVCPGSERSRWWSVHRRPVHHADDEEDQQEPDHEGQSSHVPRLCRLHVGASPAPDDGPDSRLVRRQHRRAKDALRCVRAPSWLPGGTASNDNTHELRRAGTIAIP